MNASTFCTQNAHDLIDLLSFPQCVLNTFGIPMLISVAVVLIFWGIVKYIAQSDKEVKRKEMRVYIIVVILGLFAALSVFAVINLMSATLSIGQGGEFQPLQLPE
jgi:uncharacterized membrane protein